MKVTVPPSARTCMAAVAFVALLAAVWVVLYLSAAGKSVRDGLSLLALLKAGQYATLDLSLGKLQEGHEQGLLPEAKVETAFAAFASADPDLQAKLDSWVALRPQSFAARLARGQYYLHLGRISLRNGSPATGPVEHPDAAHEFLSLASRDVEAAIERHPRLGVAYATRITVAMTENAVDQADRWFALGLEADPGSAALRRSYFLSLRPWRRPDQDAVELMAKLNSLAQDLRGADQPTPDLAALRGFPDYVTAELLRRQRRYDQADGYYRDALAEGSDWLYLRGAGINALESAKTVSAVGFFSRALALRPQDPGLLDWRAHGLWSLGNYDSALADWRLALSLDPGNPDILYGYAKALRDLGEADMAADLLANAAHFAHDNPHIRDLRGQILLQDLDRPGDAVADLRYAAEHDPSAGESWRAYAEALYRSNDCDRAAKAIRVYQRLCADGTRCSQEDLAWAKSVARGTRDPAVCPAYGILGP